MVKEYSSSKITTRGSPSFNRTSAHYSCIKIHRIGLRNLELKVQLGVVFPALEGWSRLSEDTDIQSALPSQGPQVSSWY